MKYKITIIKIEQKVITKRGDYTVIDKRPWTDIELSEALSTFYGDKKSFLEKNPLKEVRDYAPSWQVVENEETKVLEQTVETMDIAAVIKAVNGL